ncbi:MAG TPA: NADH-quinone oxidoreductase subunit J [Candidatus Limnocylindrales bacterium]
MTLPETIPFLGIGWDDLLFMTLAGVMLISGLLVVTMRNIIRCALAMIVCFAALAGLYVIASAPFVAAAEVLVYIGAISVLVLFAIMLTQTKAAPSRLVFQTQAGPAAVAGILLAIVITLAVVSTDWPVSNTLNPTDTRSVAETLFGSFVLPFEVVSVLLLAAVIGGVFLAKKEHGGID